MSDIYTTLSQRSPRERRLLATLACVLLAALAYGILSPLHSARQAAEARLAEERALQGWVQARAAEYVQLGPLKGGETTAQVAEPIGTSGLEDSLIAARLREKVSRLSAEGEGRIRLGFDSVEFTRLMTWLSGISARWGYRIESFTIARSTPEGHVQAELSLSPVQP